MKTFLKLATAAMALVTTGVATAAPLSDWYGSYSFQGQTVRGDPVTYRLNVTPNGCTVSARGPTRSEFVRCTTTPEGSSAIIKFYNFRGDTARYYNGQKLFTLSWAGPRGGGIVTRWQGMAAPDGGVSGRYFQAD